MNFLKPFNPGAFERYEQIDTNTACGRLFVLCVSRETHQWT